MWECVAAECWRSEGKFVVALARYDEDEKGLPIYTTTAFIGTGKDDTFRIFTLERLSGNPQLVVHKRRLAVQNLQVISDNPMVPKASYLERLPRKKRNAPCPGRGLTIQAQVTDYDYRIRPCLSMSGCQAEMSPVSPELLAVFRVFMGCPISAAFTARPKTLGIATVLRGRTQ